MYLGRPEGVPEGLSEGRPVVLIYSHKIGILATSGGRKWKIYHFSLASVDNYPTESHSPWNSVENYPMECHFPLEFR